MRQYGKLEPTFWTRGSGKRLRGHVEAQLVAAYLFSAPGSNMIGVFYLPVSQLTHETGLSEEGTRKGLRRVCGESLCLYDEESELVFVLGLVTRSVGETLKAKDKRVKAIEKELDQVGKHWFVRRFLELYQRVYHLRSRADVEALPSPIEAPSEAPSKPEQIRTDQSRAEAARGGAREPAAAAADESEPEPELELIREALEHPSFANIPERDEVARDRWTWWGSLQISKPTPIEWFLAAIRDAAGDCAGTGMQPHAKVSVIRRYTHAPRRPREAATGPTRAEPGSLDVEALRSRPTSPDRPHFASAVVLAEKRRSLGLPPEGAANG